MVKGLRRALFDERGGMDTCVAPSDPWSKTARLVSDAASCSTSPQPEPAPRDAGERARLRVGLAVALLPSMALWALIWYALSWLISNWP